MSGLASVWPPPPPYYTTFTDERVSELRSLEEGSEVPEHLKDLLPPSPPSEDTESYRGFGSIWNTRDQLVPLDKAGVLQLYPSGSAEGDTAALVAELRKLLGSLLVKFLGLVRTLGTDPEQFPKILDDLRVLFINMHHLLNTYRPLQSRESLVLMMREEIRRKRERSAQMRSQNAEIRDRVDLLASRLPQDQEAPTDTNPSNPDWSDIL